METFEKIMETVTHLAAIGLWIICIIALDKLLGI